MSPIRPANLFLSCICSNSTNKKQYLCYKIAETRQHYSSLTMTRKEQVISFLWQHVLLIFSLYLMTFGVVLCIKSALGSSVISSLPLSFSMAGASGLMPTLSVGGYTIGRSADSDSGQPVQAYPVVPANSRLSFWMAH